MRLGDRVARWFCLECQRVEEASSGETPSDWEQVAHALAMELIEARGRLLTLDYNWSKKGAPSSPALGAYHFSGMSDASQEAGSAVPP